jgi:predicted CoA-binding protein
MYRPTIAILGASQDRSKFGNKAVRASLLAGYEVYPINPKLAEIEGLKCYPSLSALPAGRLDRVSFYVPAKVGIQVIDELAGRDVGELWLNPGSESDELIARAESLGLDVIQACSILGVGQHPDEL